MSEQEEKELRDEIFQEEMMREELRKLSSEDLAHIDNIITGINKLKESKSNSMSLWIMLIMWTLGMPKCELFNKEKDEQNNKNGESDPVEKGTQCS